MRLNRPAFLILPVVLGLLVAGMPDAGLSAAKAASQKKKAAPAKKAAAKKPAVAAPVTLSVFSLVGETFDRRTRGDRLTETDATRYARIFALQEKEDFGRANDSILHLDDDRLMGHVLYQRYTSAHYKATYDELAKWLRDYGDHPGAQTVYDMAVARRPAGAAAPATPRTAAGLPGYNEDDSGPTAQPYLATDGASSHAKAVANQVGRIVSNGPTSAQHRLDASRASLNATQYDALRAQVAQSYFYNGKEGQAYAAASAASERSGADAPIAGWIAGLSAWKMGNYAEAAKHFERTATSPRASAWLAAAGAHWAARSYLRNHEPQKVAPWLRKAAEYPRSFYGIISAKALGMEQSRFNWDMPSLRSKLVSTLAAVPAGRRALALMDAGQTPLAELELRQINPAGDLTLQEAMMAFAHESGSPALEMRLGSWFKDRNGHMYDSALYPDAPWKPKGGYVVDRALVQAFIRQESKFDVGASNKGSGALGVMQLMAPTAKVMGQKYGIGGDFSDPAVNISLGQRYLGDMLDSDNVRDNLFKLAVAYNAGPGKLARWEKEVNYGNDPLLFIESIPVAETRSFLERVLTNYWIYRIKYGKNTDSLEKVASGDWPIYDR